MNFLQYKKDDVTLYNNPFLKDKVKLIAIFIRPERNDNFSVSASIEFRNGNTKGEQNFEASNLEDCLAQIKIFLESLM